MPQFILDMILERGATLSKGIRYSTILGKSTTTLPLQLGPATFAIASNLTIGTGQRVRASLVDNPVTDPTQYIEGPETSYAGSSLTINADVVSGIVGTSYSSWLLTAANDLTGGTFDAIMRFAPTNCVGRARTPIPLQINVTGDPTYGIFIIYLSPVVSSQLAIGDYLYRVLFTPQSSSDKFLVVNGTISVVDE